MGGWNNHGGRDGGFSTFILRFEAGDHGAGYSGGLAAKDDGERE